VTGPVDKLAHDAQGLTAREGLGWIPRELLVPRRRRHAGRWPEKPSTDGSNRAISFQVMPKLNALPGSSRPDATVGGNERLPEARLRNGRSRVH
jgi:hypothetical protein